MVDGKRTRLQTEYVEENSSERLGGLIFFVLLWTASMCIVGAFLARDLWRAVVRGEFDDTLALLALPVVGLTLVLWAVVYRSIYPKYLEPPGCEVIEDGSLVRVKVNGASTMTVWALALVLTFFCVFVVGWVWPAFLTQYSRSISVMVGVYASILILAAVITRWLCRRWNSIRYDLVLDRLGRQVQLPVDRVRKEPQFISLDQIIEARHEIEVRTDFDGDTYHIHWVCLDVEDETGEVRSESIHVIEGRRADLVARWLNEIDLVSPI